MAEVLNVQKRDLTGKRNNRRLRLAGMIPAVLYGHGQENVSLAVSDDEINAAVRQGTRLFDLKGPVNESALIRDTQWNTFGTHLLHIDFTRASADERIDVGITLELRGEAPGLKKGGIVEQLAHELEIQCPAAVIPERIVVNVNSLELGQSITAAEIELPEGATLVTPADAALVQCVEPVAEEELDAAVGESVEPEVIGRKAGEEESSE